MKSWLCCIGLVAVGVFASAACSDSSTTTGSGGSGGTGGATGGTGGTAGTGGSGADDGGGGSSGSAPEGGGDATTVACTTVYDNDKIAYTGTGVPVYTCNGSKSTNYPDGPNACRNDSDCAMINTGKVRDLVKTCALGCRSYEPPMGTCAQEADCNTTCVKMATATNIMQPGISAACGACYTDVALCSVAFCVGQCAVDADAIDCIKCQFINGCRVPYERCSGLDRQP